MKALFAYDARFYSANANIYSGVYFPASIWQRYLEHFDRLTVAARDGGSLVSGEEAGLELSSTAGVTFELLPNLSSPVGLLLTRHKVRKRMRSLVAGVDVVIARLPGQFGHLAIDCAEEQGKPWAVEVVGCAFDGLWHHGSLQGKLYAPVAFARMRRKLSRARFALYVTERFLQSRYPCKSGFIANASNVALPPADVAVLEHRLRRLADSRVERPLRLGLIGSLQTRAKGVQTVIAALSAARADLPPVTFHVLGPGDQRPWRKLAEQSGIADIVFFEECLPPGAAVLKWLDTIDVYLQPSLQEGLPRALLEAMSRACPAIGSRRAGIPELLVSEDLITPGNARELAAMLQERLVDFAWMKCRARSNWEKSRKYEASNLDKQRSTFWAAFKGAALEQTASQHGRHEQSF